MSTRRNSLVAGALVLGLILLVNPPAGWTPGSWSVAGIGLVMAIWWMTEAIPIPVTALLPIVLFPAMGVSSIKDAAAPYAHPLIFLFLGGFLLAEAVQQAGLHRRIALLILTRTAHSVDGIVIGFMIATAFLSMWVTNTATTIMMLPIALSVLSMTSVRPEGDPESGETGIPPTTGSGIEASGRAEPRSSDSQREFATYLLLAVAYSATIGGLATLVGTAPNTFMAAFLSETYGVEIGFGTWMLVGVPLMLMGLPIVFFVLKKLFGTGLGKQFDGGTGVFDRQLDTLGPWSPREVRIGLLFSIVAVSWIFRPVLAGFISGLSDTGIALGGAVILFVIPSGNPRTHEEGEVERLLSWEQSRNIPWGVLLLFGGGLALAQAVSDTGLAVRIGDALAALDMGYFLGVAGVFVTITILLTEMTSNTAVTAAFLPVVGAVAVSLGVDPVILIVPTTIAASCAFMLPVATPPNAIVYGSGMVPSRAMIKAGVWLNLIFMVVVTLSALVIPALL